MAPPGASTRVRQAPPAWGCPLGTQPPVPGTGRPAAGARHQAGGSGPPTSRPSGTWPSTPTHCTPQERTEMVTSTQRPPTPRLLSQEAGFLAPAVPSGPTLTSTPG